jgi:glycine/D-amino acid oxidase-like deaminating enzyme
MPIIGKFRTAKNPDVDRRVASDRLWIFTGLSSRGLIYHGLFGRMLAEAVSHDNEVTLQQQFQEFDWWRQQKNHSKIDKERIELKT